MKNPARFTFMAALTLASAALSSCATHQTKDEGTYTLNNHQEKSTGVDHVGASIGVYGGYASGDFQDSRRISGLAQ